LFSFSFSQKRADVLSREKEDLAKEHQQLSKQLDEIKQQGNCPFWISYPFTIFRRNAFLK
jgi:hypothetical protein